MKNSIPTTQSDHQSTEVRIIDLPCGSGKTTNLISSFQEHQNYLVVKPLLSEVERIIEGAKVPFQQPSSKNDRTKSEHLRDLLIWKQNVVTTHALYSDLAAVAREGLLDDYHIIIDEVPEVAKQFDGKSPKSWEEFYINDGYAKVAPSGLVSPTAKWDADHEAVMDTLDIGIYHAAKAGCLYRLEDCFFMWALPKELLSTGVSVTVYTYQAQGSLLLPYLKKMGIETRLQSCPATEAAFKKQAKELVSMKTISALDGLVFSASAQSSRKIKERKLDKKVAIALKNLKSRELKGVSDDMILLTCLKQNWFLNGKGYDARKPAPGPFASGANMFKTVHWLANTTRGTNEHAHCSRMIYLWDQHPNPYVAKWLGMSQGDKEAYALTELIQWVWRSRVRKGAPITLYLPSERMRRIFSTWLES